jgi:hypothetical protein
MMTTAARRTLTAEAFTFYRAAAQHSGGTRTAYLRKALRRFEELGTTSMITCIERLMA